MTKVNRRLIVSFAVVCGVVGIVFLVITGLSTYFYSQKQPVEIEEISEEPQLEELVIVDTHSAQQGEIYSLETDLEKAQLASQLDPLKPWSAFTAQTAQEITISTNKGDIVITLFADQAPYTITNLLTLIDENFYDNLKFHRVEENFVVQVGDPASREASSEAELLLLGAGGPGYRIADEISPELSHDRAGIVAMANKNYNGSLPDSGGSQFYITLEPTTYLDGRYSIFGEVTSGMDVVQRLRVGDTITSITYR